MPSAIEPATLALWAYISGKPLVPLLQLLLIHLNGNLLSSGFEAMETIYFFCTDLLDAIVYCNHNTFDSYVLNEVTHD